MTGKHKNWHREWCRLPSGRLRHSSAALGVSRGTYADWLAGRSRTTGKPIRISRLVALACAALAAGVPEWAAAAHRLGFALSKRLA